MRTFAWIICGLLVAAYLPSAAAQPIVVDNDAGAPGYAENGVWTTSSSTGYNGGTYRFTRDTDPPSWARWTPDLPQAGSYDVAVHLLTSTNRTPDAPFTILHVNGTSVVHVDMRGPIQVATIPLGRFNFNAGTAGSVRLDNNGGAGAYIADAISFTPTVDTPPLITELSFTPSFPQAGEQVFVTARVEDEGAVQSVTLHYSPGGQTVPALDDGTRNDGAPGDGVYGAIIPGLPDETMVSFYLTATDEKNQTSTSASLIYTVGDDAPRRYRALWIDSWNISFLSPTQTENLVQTARDNNINTIVPEVRKIGDAYYDSNLEPRATNISGGPSYDPLAHMIALCHDTSGGKGYIEVHAWFVMHRITTGETLHPQHILARHPEYVMLDSNGLAGSGTRFLDPGHPDAANHNVEVILDCLRNYAIDGINLDYIRYPEASGSWGYNPVSVQRFNAFHGRTGQPASDDPAWGDWRRRMVTQEVRKIYIKSVEIDPMVVITADTVNWGFSWNNWEASDPYNRVFQNWVGWLEEGILDYNMLMGYSTSASRFTGWMNLSLAHDDKRGSIIGQGSYLQSSVQNSMDQLAEVYASDAAGATIYDWGSEVNGTGGTATRSDFYNALRTQLHPEWVDTPLAPWKVDPRSGHIHGTITYNGTPVDHATVEIEGNPATQIYSDGLGWYGLIDVPRGSQVLKVSKAGLGEARVPVTMPEAGDFLSGRDGALTRPPRQDILVIDIDLAEPPSFPAYIRLY